MYNIRFILGSTYGGFIQPLPTNAGRLRFPRSFSYLRCENLTASVSRYRYRYREGTVLLQRAGARLKAHPRERPPSLTMALRLEYSLLEGFSPFAGGLVYPDAKKPPLGAAGLSASDKKPGPKSGVVRI